MVILVVRSDRFRELTRRSLVCLATCGYRPKRLDLAFADADIPVVHVAGRIAVPRHEPQLLIDLHEVVNGLMYVLSTGCQWPAIPKDLPPKSTVYEASRWPSPIRCSSINSSAASRVAKNGKNGLARASGGCACSQPTWTPPAFGEDTSPSSRRLRPSRRVFKRARRPCRRRVHVDGGVSDKGNLDSGSLTFLNVAACYRSHDERQHVVSKHTARL